MDYLIYLINEKPDAWSILSNFFGIHRIYLSSNLDYPHPFLKLFKIGKIPIRAAIKFIHTNNHSCHDYLTKQNGNGNGNGNIKDDIVNRYVKSGLIPKSPINDNKVNEVIIKFAINSLLK